MRNSNQMMICFLILLAVGSASSLACKKKDLAEPTESSSAPLPTPTPTPTPTQSPQKFLYVTAGVCHGGPNTTFTGATASNQVYRINADTGLKDITLADYWTAPANAGDSPAGIAESSDDSLMVLIENATAGFRRIERINKVADSTRTTFSSNIAALSAPLRSIISLVSGDFLIAKTTGIEYITSSSVRVGAPYANPSANPCTSSNTGISHAIMLTNGKILFLHAAAAQNKIGSLSQNGGTACLATQAAPAPTAYPVAAFYDSANTTLVVAYSGTTTALNLNSIYSYSVNEETGGFSNPQKLYDANGFPGTYNHLLFAISEMTFDSATNTVYIATAVNTATPVQNYQIEKFSYDPTKIGTSNSEVLTKHSDVFYPYGSDTKCISSMMISE